jgi:inhibitor of the pro-sigma K processing machinery
MLQSVFAYIFGLLLLFIVGRLLLAPIKIVLRLIYNGILGGLLLIIVNFVGGFFNINIGINPITAIVTGILGIPGVVLLLVLQWFFKV